MSKPVGKLITLIFFTALLFSCRKESFTSSSAALIRTSLDSLHFDTVFTTTGSVTQFIKIINDNNKGIRISDIRLAGGINSPFKINVDGMPGPVVNNVEISANDSTYIFVSVSINPLSSNLPFIVRDSIELIANGNRSWIQLDAYGQNAHFLRNHKITSNTTWNNDLPYVILGEFIVDTIATLTINKGCRIHMHADAPFIVHGSLKVEGEKWDSTRVIFTGDRLDQPYKDFPGSYPGLIFSGSSIGNTFNYAIIKNAYQGIVTVDPASNGAPKIRLNQTIIENAYDAGILSVNSGISAINLLVSNCGKNIILAKGGNYDFTHSTIATVSNNFIPHKEPVLLMTNYLNQNNVISSGNLNAVFRNCIIWGDENGMVENEVVLAKQGSGTISLTFDQVLWRVQTPPSPAIINGAINNQEPLFEILNTSENNYSFRLKTGSPAINKGVPAGLTLDLDGNQRPIGLPDLGAYEKQ